MHDDWYNLRYGVRLINPFIIHEEKEKKGGGENQITTDRHLIIKIRNGDWKYMKTIQQFFPFVISIDNRVRRDYYISLEKVEIPDRKQIVMTLHQIHWRRIGSSREGVHRWGILGWKITSSEEQLRKWCR